MRKVANSSDVAYLLYPIVPLEWLLRLGRLYGTLTYYLRRSARSTVRQNLERTFGSTRTARELDSLTRQFFQYKRVRGVLLAVAPRMSGATIEKLLPMHGLERLDQALEQQRGVILLGSHINSVCLFLTTILLRERGYDVRTALAEDGEPWPRSRLRRFLDRRFGTSSLRELIGGFYTQFNIRPIVRALAENAIVVQTGDGLHSARFVEVEFLGSTVPFTTGMASVARVTGATVVPIFELGAPPDTLRAVIEEPWTVEAGADGDRAVESAVTAYAERLEHHLLENVPSWEHWLIEDVLETMAAWTKKPLEERYAVR